MLWAYKNTELSCKYILKKYGLFKSLDWTGIHKFITASSVKNKIIIFCCGLAQHGFAK